MNTKNSEYKQVIEDSSKTLRQLELDYKILDSSVQTKADELGAVNDKLFEVEVSIPCNNFLSQEQIQ